MGQSQQRNCLATSRAATGFWQFQRADTPVIRMQLEYDQRKHLCAVVVARSGACSENGGSRRVGAGGGRRVGVASPMGQIRKWRHPKSRCRKSNGANQKMAASEMSASQVCLLTATGVPKLGNNRMPIPARGSGLSHLGLGTIMSN